MADYRSFDRSQLIAHYCQLTSSDNRISASKMSRKELIAEIQKIEAQLALYRLFRIQGVNEV